MLSNIFFSSFARKHKHDYDPVYSWSFHVFISGLSLHPFERVTVRYFCLYLVYFLCIYPLQIYTHTLCTYKYEQKDYISINGYVLKTIWQVFKKYIKNICTEHKINQVLDMNAAKNVLRVIAPGVIVKTLLFVGKVLRK